MAEKTQDMHLPSLKVHGEVFEDYRNEAIEFNYICVSLLSAKRQRKDNGIYFPIMLAGSAARRPSLFRRGASAAAKENQLTMIPTRNYSAKWPPFRKKRLAALFRCNNVTCESFD